jgi:TPR repeat protein
MENCPVCLENFEFNYKCILCYVCGGLICDGCRGENKINLGGKCPICREFLRPNNRELIFLFALAERGEGFKYYSMVSYDIAERYCQDIKIQKGKELAFKWYYRSALNGDPRAQCKIGKNMLKGVDREEGIYWLEKSVMGENYPRGHYNLGVLYDEEGKYIQAYNQYILAGMAGIPEANHALGEYCLKGKGVAKNIEEAYRHFFLSYEKGYSKSAYELGLIHYNRKEYKISLEYFHFRVKDSDSKALYYLGILYGMGAGCEKNLSESVYFFHKSSLLKNVESKKILDSISDIIVKESKLE